MKSHVELLDYLDSYIRQNGFSPSVREIGEVLGYKSSASVHDYLVKMEDNGLIKRIGTRGIRVLQKQLGPDEITVVKRHKGTPSVIMWQGRRYVLDSSVR